MRTLRAELAVILSQPDVRDFAHLSACRQQLASVIMDHIPMEDEFVFRPLFACPDFRVAEKARAFRVQLDDYLARYQSHAARWTDARIAADWDEYRQTATEMLDDMIVRIDGEERTLYPYLETLAPNRAPSASNRDWAADFRQINAGIG